MEQLSDEAIVSDLYSKDAARVEAAIKALKAKVNEYRWVAMAPLGADILDTLGPDIEQGTLFDFLEIVQFNRRFNPPLSETDKFVISIAVVLRYGAKTSVTYNVALDLKGAKDPVQAVEFAMAEVPRQGLLSLRNVHGAQYLVSCLLDGSPAVRRATLESLRRWPQEEPYQQVRKYITPELEPDELELLSPIAPDRDSGAGSLS